MDLGRSVESVAQTALNDVLRRERSRLLATLIGQFRDFQLAEDALHDASVSALEHWPRFGTPHSPYGWLLRAACRKAIDRLRKGQTATRHAAAQSLLASEIDEHDDAHEIADERLRLIFTCCHPALEQKTQVALTLRSVAGLSTGRIADAFLDKETTMAQRLSRAKAKILEAQIPYAVPGAEVWASRLQSVLQVIYLIYNAGYSAGPDFGAELTGEALFLAHMLNELRPEEPEIEGCLALIVITNARRAARLSPDGVSVPLDRQDRRLWKQEEIANACALATTALRRGRPGPFQIKAAIAACHCEADEPDWPQIAALYDSLLVLEPTPVVRLNRAVAIAETGATASALRLLNGLAGELQDYQSYHAAAAELFARLEMADKATQAYGRAIALSTNDADIKFLECRLLRLKEDRSA